MQEKLPDCVYYRCIRLERRVLGINLRKKHYNFT